MRRKIVNADWTTIIGLVVLLIALALIILGSWNHQRQPSYEINQTTQMAEVMER